MNNGVYLRLATELFRDTVPLLGEIDAIVHISISSLVLHIYCSELAKKHLFDLRFILIRGRPFPRMGAPDPLCPERGYADGAYSFPGSANDVSVIWEHLLDIRLRSRR